MNRSLLLAECSHPISWVSVGISRNVCWYLAECSLRISRIVRWHFTECLLVFCGVFCVYFVGVRNVIAIRQQHFGKPFAAVGVRFIVPVPMKYPEMALQFVIFCTSRQIEKREKQTHDVCFSLVFYVLN